jgi:hypothetical protein
MMKMVSFLCLIVDLNFTTGTWIDLVLTGNAISQRIYTVLLKSHETTKQQAEKTLAFMQRR